MLILSVVPAWKQTDKNALEINYSYFLKKYGSISKTKYVKGKCNIIWIFFVFNNTIAKFCFWEMYQTVSMAEWVFRGIWPKGERAKLENASYTNFFSRNVL